MRASVEGAKLDGMARLVTPAIVLRTVDYGEADRVVTLLAREGGKRAAIARGARKSTKRFGAGLSIFGVGEATLVERPRADLDVLDGFHGARGFPRIALDVAKVAHAGYACEVVRELVPPREPEPRVFELLVEFLGLVDGGEPRAETLRVFELHLLDAIGLRPTLDRCASCGADDALDGAGQVFDARAGGVVCATCHGHGRPLDGDARRALLRAQSLALHDAPSLALAPAVNAACRDAIAELVIDHVGRPLKSLEFIHKMNQAQT